MRSRAFIFVTIWLHDQVRDEVSVIFGFDAARRSHLQVGGEAFELAGDADGAWTADLADEARLVRAMRGQAQLVIRSRSALGEDMADTYSLNGFGEALDQARRQCADPSSTS